MKFRLPAILFCVFLVFCACEVTLYESPRVDLKILKPGDGEFISYDNAQILSLKVRDYQGKCKTLYAVWRSDTDGELGTAAFNPKEISSLTVSTLSVGTHTISVRVTGSDGLDLTDSIQVYNLKPPPVTLDLVNNPGSTIDLSWTKCSPVSFKSYTVYRSLYPEPSVTGSAVAVITDLNTLSFEDGTVDSSEDYFYQVVCENLLGYSSGSNTEFSRDSRFFNFNIVDAEYSRSLDRIIAVSASPNRLHTIEPVSGTVNSIPLKKEPTCVAVSPDGMMCAVGHEFLVSYVDLNTMELVSESHINAPAGDLVLKDDGFCYIFPSAKQGVYMHSLNLLTGEETVSGGMYERSKGRIHPSGNWLYMVEPFISPQDFDKYDISAGTASSLYDSPYHGDYEIKGDFWISEDGTKLYAKSGNVFTSDAVKADDMLYTGSLSDTTDCIGTADSASAGKIWVIAAEDDTAVQKYNGSTFILESSIGIPPLSSKGTEYDNHGEYVFTRQDGSSIAVITRADSSLSLARPYGVCVLDGSFADPGCPDISICSPPENAAVSLPFDIYFKCENCTPGQGSEELQLYIDGEYSRVVSGTGPIRINTLSAGKHDVSLVLTDNGISTGVMESVTVYNGAEPDNRGESILFGYNIIDAQYSAELDIVVMLSVEEQKLYMYHPITKVQEDIILPYPPTCMSISRDGLKCVVGYDGYISDINLASSVINNTFPVPWEPYSIVYADNGYAYYSPGILRGLTWVNLSDGTWTEDTLRDFRDSLIKLHPEEPWIYGQESGNFLRKFDISGINPVMINDGSPFEYVGFFSEFWFLSNGSRMIGDVGVVFTLGVDTAVDMEYFGRAMLPYHYVQAAVYEADTGMIALICRNMDLTFDNEIRYYDENTLIWTDSKPFRGFDVSETEYTAHGKYLFLNRDKTYYYIIGEVDFTAGLTKKNGIIIINR